MDGTLIDIRGRAARPAADIVGDLVNHLEQDLRAHAEWHLVAPVVHTVLTRGPGSARQRAALAAGGGLAGVVDAAVREMLAAI